MKPWQFIWPIGKATTDPAVVQLALGPDPGSKVIISRDGGRAFAHYSRTRVYLDRDAWEALEGPDDVLVERIRRPDSPELTIALTRSELEAVFGPVRGTASWDQERCYHFPIDPPATTAFLVTREGEPVTPTEDREPERRSWVSRTALGPILRTMFAEFGSAPIHGKILVERGLSPSAVKHPAYWSASQPGGKAAADVGLAGTLHRHVDGDQLRPELVLRKLVQRPGSAPVVTRATRASVAAAIAAVLDPPLSALGEQHLAAYVRGDLLAVLERALQRGAGTAVDGTVPDKAAALSKRLNLGAISIDDATEQLANTTIEVLDKLLRSIPVRPAAPSGPPFASVARPALLAEAAQDAAPTSAPAAPRLPQTDAWTLLPAGPVREWLSGVANEDHRRVLAHIAAHGSITEKEVNTLLGSAARARRFTAGLDGLMIAAPMAVRVDVVNGVKLYVKS